MRGSGFSYVEDLDMEEGILDKTDLEELSKRFNRELTLQDFVDTMESGVVFNMTTDQYNEIIEDIRDLASLDEEVLREKIEKTAEDMHIGMEFSGEEMKKVLGQFRALKEYDYSKPVPQALLAFVCQILTVEYESRYKSQPLLDKNIKMMRFLLWNDLRLKMALLKSRPEFQEIPSEVLFLIRDVVFDEATGQMLETLKNENLHELIHRIRASFYQGKRWESKKRLYDAALKHADDLWAEGNTLERNQMADYIMFDETLHTNYVFADLNYDELRKRLKPLAEKYGRLPPRGRPRRPSK